MSNNKSNSNNTKTKLSVMIAAFASVLLAGMGLSSPAYASIMDNVFPKFKADDVGQSAECVGVAIECRENSDNIKVKNKNINNGNVNGNGVLTCEECFEEHLSPEQISALLVQLNVADLAAVCADLDAIVLLNALIAIGIEADSDITAALFACLGLELPTIVA